MCVGLLQIYFLTSGASLCSGPIVGVSKLFRKNEVLSFSLFDFYHFAGVRGTVHIALFELYVVFVNSVVFRPDDGLLSIDVNGFSQPHYSLLVIMYLFSV